MLLPFQTTRLSFSVCVCVELRKGVSLVSVPLSLLHLSATLHCPESPPRGVSRNLSPALQHTHSTISCPLFRLPSLYSCLNSVSSSYWAPAISLYESSGSRMPSTLRFMNPLLSGPSESLFMRPPCPQLFLLGSRYSLYEPCGSGLTRTPNTLRFMNLLLSGRPSESRFMRPPCP
jgi:hypothetical protein